VVGRNVHEYSLLVEKSMEALQKPGRDQKEMKPCQVLLEVHTYNPRYVEGRDQEDHGLKSAPCKYFLRP
jgi:hypothetical protein